VVPWETSNYDELPGRFTYKGESISFSEIGGNLTVDGKFYGSLKTGDQVNLLTKGAVIVNLATRQSVSSTIQP